MSAEIIFSKEKSQIYPAVKWNKGRIIIFSGRNEWMKWSEFLLLFESVTWENIYVGKHSRIVSMENQEREEQVSLYMICNSLNTVLHLILMWFLSFQTHHDRDSLLQKDTDGGGTSSMSSASFNFINSIIGSGIIGKALVY